MTTSLGQATHIGVAPSPRVKVRPEERPSHYPLPAWLIASAERMGCTPGTAKVRAFAPGGAFDQVETFLGQMVAHGNLALAERKMQRLELAFCAAAPADIGAALLADCEVDAKQDLARDRFLVEDSNESLTALERALTREIVEKQRALRAVIALRRARAQ